MEWHDGPWIEEEGRLRELEDGFGRERIGEGYVDSNDSAAICS